MFRSALAVLCATMTIVAPLSAEVPRTRPPNGLRQHPPRAVAIRGARLFVEPERIVPVGTLVFREGKFTAVGADVRLPPDVEVLDYTGKTIYAGFIDAYSEVSLPDVDSDGPGRYWNDEVTPERKVAEVYRSDPQLDRTLRSQGFVARVAAPASGVIRGQSALVETGEGEATRVLVPQVALHVRLTVDRNWSDSSYPNSPMGAVALARQAFYDATWYREAWQTWEGDQALPLPERNDALAALAAFREGGVVLIEASNELFHLRADRFAREFGLRLVVHGSGMEYRRLEEIRRAGRPVILPLDFPAPPSVASPEAALDVSLTRLLHWDLAPENPARVVGAGLPIALTSHGLKDRSAFLAALRRAVRRGLPVAAALRALTSGVAEIFGFAQLGTLARGKHASFVVTDGDLFSDTTKILETWIDGRRHRVAPAPAREAAGEWRLELGAHEGRPSVILLRVADDGKSAKVRPEKTLEGFEGAASVSHFARVDALVSGSFAATAASAVAEEKESGGGLARFSVVLDPTSSPDAVRTGLGQLVWPGGATVSLRARQVSSDETAKPDAAATAAESRGDAAGDETAATGEHPGLEAKQEAGKGEKAASYAVNYPLGAYGVQAPPAQPEAVLIQGATVWTCGPEGVIEGGDVLFGRGSIRAVGADLEVPRGALVVDGSGLHVTPGLIDCHSHIATDGGINESGQAITAEVRIGDFIDCDDIRIFRQLAGGVTSANILHGSANPIGGQNQVIKMRWGGVGSEMAFAAAPAGIKFALGENVKQSNWGDDYTSRYPQTRMGVEQIFRDEFHAAERYLKRQREWRTLRRGLPPRRDLELEAIGEILEGKRWIHCHSYRQDEILAFLQVLDDFEVTIGTLQHILEGYKVADAMREHGAMASTFSDWWGYKFEVYDAIPYAGALMHDAGVVVSFNSDDGELGRHLNQEAAKAVRYGGVPPADALLFVTRNPARQLRIDSRVGSLESGKDADLVVWNGPPLSNYSLCLETWIDGRKYFDRTEASERAAKALEMRRVLIEKILAHGNSTGAPGAAEKKDPAELWPRGDHFCSFHEEDVLGGDR